MEGKFERYRRDGRRLVSKLKPYVKAERRMKQLDKMADCGNFLQFTECVVNPDHDSRLKHANFCMNRFCPMCQWRRGLKYSHDAYEAISSVLRANPDYGLVHVTVTIKNREIYSVVDHKKFMGDFYKLRRGKLFKPCIGGLWAVEVTDKGKGYHPHVHALCIVPRNAKGLPVLVAQADLSKEWLRITGDSFVVGIRAVYDKADSNSVYDKVSPAVEDSNMVGLEKAVVEVCKYPFGGVEVFNPERLVGLMDVFDGSRMVGTWGALYGVKEEDSDLVHVTDESDEPCCKVCGSVMCDVDYVWSGAHYERHARIFS